ncbi:hypothetical protein FQN50_007478 [Emmonsiellopsis sp. PD_5]|nr:hypothetical protein FQN50_007478 [Emmonsiellopsis sp. PD_5]
MPKKEGPPVQDSNTIAATHTPRQHQRQRQQQQNNATTTTAIRSTSPLVAMAMTMTMATNTDSHSPMNQSFADSAIDMDSASETVTVTTKTPEETTTTTTTTTTKDVPSITQRLAHLVRLSENRSDNGKNTAAASPELSRQKDMAIQQYLDGIEALLDPHDGEMGSESTIIMEHEECAEPIPPPPPATIQGPETTPRNDRGSIDIHSQLNALMGDLKVVTTRLEQRRAESLHLNAVFTIKCERLAQRILQLEDEIQEL